MQTGTLIIGQGLCGTWLSFWLQQAKAGFMVIDEAAVNGATRVASGIINPVTGRRMVKTWMADELLPFAWEAYNKMGAIIKQEIIAETELVDFFSSPDRRLSFEKRAGEFESYLNWPENEHEWHSYFNYPFGFGIVSPVYQANLQGMLSGWRNFLSAEGNLRQEKYEPTLLQLTGRGIEYKDIQAERIIFCDGVAVMDQPFFKLLPFAFNKGEALIVDIPGLPAGRLFKKGSIITPWQHNLFWVGSIYDRDYRDDRPSKSFYDQTFSWLSEFLKLPFTVEDHLAAIRPTTVERRPFAGMHPHYKQVGILNGMGTKGVSISPYLAKQLAENMLAGTPVLKEADVHQYARVLQRNV